MADEVPVLPFGSEEEWTEENKSPPQTSKSPPQHGSPSHASDVPKMFRDMESRIVAQNNKILSQVSRMAADISYLSKDVSKLFKSVSKLEYGNEKDTHCLNTLRCEFQTFSWRAMASLRTLERNPDVPVPPDDGLWNVYFHGENDVFSNFYPSPLRLNGLVFRTAEHLYQYKKAEHHGLEKTAGEEILNAPHGGAAKSAARRHIVVNTEWELVCGEVMEDVLRVKAAQCREFRDRLLSTGDKGLVHDLPVYLWGWGTHGQGQNLMGRALEKVRAYLQESTSSTFSLDGEREEAETQVENKAEAVDSKEGNRENVTREKQEPQWEESGRRGKKKGKKQNREPADVAYVAQDNKESLNLKDDQHWPALGDSSGATNSPVSRSPKRQVTQDMSGMSLQVKVSVGKMMEEMEEQGIEGENEKTNENQSRQRQQRQGAKYSERNTGRQNWHQRGGGRFSGKTDMAHSENNYSNTQEPSSPNYGEEPSEGQRESYQNVSSDVPESGHRRQQWPTQDGFHDNEWRPPRRGRGRGGQTSSFRGGRGYHGNNSGGDSSYHGNNRNSDSGYQGNRYSDSSHRGNNRYSDRHRGNRDRHNRNDDRGHRGNHQNYNSRNASQDPYENRMYSDLVERQGSWEGGDGGGSHHPSNQEKPQFSDEQGESTHAHPRENPSPRGGSDVGGSGGQRQDHGGMTRFSAGHPPGEQVGRTIRGVDHTQQRAPPTKDDGQTSRGESGDQRHVVVEST